MSLLNNLLNRSCSLCGMIHLLTHLLTATNNIPRSRLNQLTSGSGPMCLAMDSSLGPLFLVQTSWKRILNYGSAKVEPEFNIRVISFLAPQTPFLVALTISPCYEFEFGTTVFSPNFLKTNVEFRLRKSGAGIQYSSYIISSSPNSVPTQLMGS